MNFPRVILSLSLVIALVSCGRHIYSNARHAESTDSATPTTDTATRPTDSATPTTDTAAASRFDHVIILGFDGLAGMAVDSADAMPQLKKMMEEGAWMTRKRSVLPSSSAINWATMFMGAGPEAHGYVEWNSKAPHFTPSCEGMFPTVFRLLRDQKPGSEIGCTWQWEGIKYVIDTTAFSMTRQFGDSIEDASDEFAFAAGYIKEKKPVLAAFICDYPDVTGHSLGWYTPEYYAMLGRIDGFVGDIRKAIVEAGIGESTLLIVTSDHGGHERGHGQALDEDVFGPFVVSGPGIRKGHCLKLPVYQYDIAATIADALGLEMPEQWRGRPVAEMYE